MSRKVEVPNDFVNITKCPKWYINREGEVWSVNKGGLLSPHQSGTGYKQLIYGRRGFRKKYYIHRLVAETFIGEIPEKHCVNHVDGNKLNNNVGNLEIVTQKQNNQHAIVTGLKKKWRGETHPHSKLTEEDVINIRRRKKNGESGASIARDYTVSAHTINDVYRGKSWKWLA